MFEPLPTLIRLQRERQGLTIDALSALARVSRTRLVSLEKGDDNISLELLVKIANALQMTELRIGGLRVTETKPDFNALVAAADALREARRLAEQAAQMLDEIDRLEEPVFALLAPVLTPAKPAGRTVARKRAAQRRA